MDPTRRLRSTLSALALAGAFAACGGTGLSSGAWAWCKLHLTQVDTAAGEIGIPIVKTTIQEPTWWPDFVTSMQNANVGLLKANADFLASCDRAAADYDVGDSRLSWCASDGVGPAWTAAVALGLITDEAAETFAYRAIPLEQRIDNADFGRACNSAYASRTS